MLRTEVKVLSVLSACSPAELYPSPPRIILDVIIQLIINTTLIASQSLFLSLMPILCELHRAQELGKQLQYHYLFGTFIMYACSPLNKITELLISLRTTTMITYLRRILSEALKLSHDWKRIGTRLCGSHSQFQVFKVLYLVAFSTSDYVLVSKCFI